MRRVLIGDTSLTQQVQVLLLLAGVLRRCTAHVNRKKRVVAAGRSRGGALSSAAQ